MVHAYWLVGREIVEVEQRGDFRAKYGERLIERLAERLNQRFGRGMSIATLRRIRSFYLSYPEGSQIPSNISQVEIRSTPLIESTHPGRDLFPRFLGWSHYLVLLRVRDPKARAFHLLLPGRKPRCSQRGGAPLVLDVSLNHVERRATARDHAVAGTPEVCAIDAVAHLGEIRGSQAA